MDAVGAGSPTAFVIADGDTIDVNVVREQYLHSPESGALEQNSTTELNLRRILNQDQPRSARVIVRGPSQALRLIRCAKIPIRLPPYWTIAVDSSRPGDRDVLLIAHIDEPNGPGHLDTCDASRQHRSEEHTS